MHKSASEFWKCLHQSFTMNSMVYAKLFLFFTLQEGVHCIDLKEYFILKVPSIYLNAEDTLQVVILCKILM